MGTGVQTMAGVPSQRTGNAQDTPAQMVGEARAFARRWLGTQSAVVEELADAVEVVVSELVTNAVTHTGGLRAMDLDVCDGQLFVWVEDCDPDHFPIKSLLPSQEADECAFLCESGRGLFLVAALADRWGVEVTSQVKRVWASFKL